MDDFSNCDADDFTNIYADDADTMDAASYPRYNVARETGYLMQVREIKLNDLSGGLNQRDFPSKLKANEAAELENWITDEGGLGKKRFGKSLVQYAPIDPQVFVTDANTLGIWSFDELVSTDNVLDSSGNANNLNFGFAGAPSEKALFPIATPLGRKGIIAGPLVGDGSRFQNSNGLGFHGLTKMTLEGMIKIPSTYTGKPYVVNRNNTDFTLSQSGVILAGGSALKSIGGYVSAFENGFRIFRDWDATESKDASDPYLKFRLQTSGIPGTVTEVTSLALPFDVMLHIKATYDDSTRQLQLFVNGQLHAEATVNGGGAIFSTETGSNFYVFGDYKYQYAMGSAIAESSEVIMDEWRLSNSVRTGFPFKEPRGIIPEFIKSDGTRQNICAAEDGLYYTINDGDWVKIGDGFDTLADWDFKQFGDIMYMSNGVDDPYAWDGTTLKPMGEAITAPLLTEAASGTTPAIGTYQYAFTYWFTEDIETGPSLVETITTVGAHNINIDELLMRHSNCILIRVYRTKTGSDIFYLIREIVNDAEADKATMTGLYVDNGSPADDKGADGVPDGTLGTGDYVEMDSVVATTRMRKWKYAAVNYERFFMAGMSDSQYDLDFSEIGAPDVRPALSFVTAKTDRGPLVALATYYGEIHASKDGKATLVLRGDNPNNWRQFETLHPEIGCVDHWSYVHRTLGREEGSSTDRYMLTFMALDGFYGYLGGEFFKISDILGPFINSLGATASARQQYTTSQLAEWLDRFHNGGSVTKNIYNSLANTDGLIQEPGTLQIVDQLDYIGLWDRTANSNPAGVSGKVLAIAKSADEGEFYFSTDGDDNVVFFTPDNFQTATALPVAPGITGEFIHHIVRTLIGAVENLFVFTSDTDEKGGVYRIEDPRGASGIGPNLSDFALGPFYWKSDTRFRFNTGSPTSQSTATFTDFFDPNGSLSGFVNKNFYLLGNPGRIPNSGRNIYLNHAQKIFLSFANTSFLHLFYNPDLTGASASLTGNLRVNNGYTDIAVPYISVRDPANFHQVTGGAAAFVYDELSSGGYFMYAQRRDTALWQGGVCSPQAFYDTVNDRLWFVAGTAPDAVTGIISNKLWSYTLAGAGTAVATTDGHIALTKDGASTYFTALTTVQGGVSVTLKKSLLSSLAVTTVAALQNNKLFYRLEYDSNSGKILGTGKYFDLMSIYDIYNYTGFIDSLTIAGVSTSLKSFASQPDGGYFPLEIAVQTVTPFAAYVVMQNYTTATDAVYAIASPFSAAGNVMAYRAEAYAGISTAQNANRIITKLIFVENSGLAGSNLWADRLYWGSRVSGTDLGSLIQLGMPGEWTVIGVYLGEQKNIGSFSALGKFLADFSGEVDFDFSNAADAASLAAAFVSQAPNTKILGFPVPGAFLQWRVTMTWEYGEDVPRVEFVNIEYYVNGSPQNPRVVGMHYRGRTYWAVSTDGSTKNNLVLVYQKNNTWTTYTGWRIKGFGTFGNNMVALEDFQYVQLEDGLTDIGNLIEFNVLTGGIMDEPRDKAMREVIANVQSYVNGLFPDRPAYIKVLTVRAGEDLEDTTRIIEVPTDAAEVPSQVTAFPVLTDPQEFIGNGWARAMQIRVKTSDEAAYVPPVNQAEKIEQLLIRLYVSPPRRQQSVR